MTLPKLASMLALGALGGLLALAVTGQIAQTTGLVKNSETVERTMKIAVFMLFLIFAFALIPLLLHVFLSLQERMGNANAGMIRFLRSHENGVVYFVWGFYLLGLLIALPVMWTDFFGFPSYIGRSQGVLRANIGMTLEEVQRGSTLKVAEGKREGLTGSRMSIADVVFDFEVAGTGMRFPSSRYYWMNTGAHDDLKLNSINIGISSRKMTLDGIHAFEQQLRQQLTQDGWQAGHYVYKTEESVRLHGGEKTGGEGQYWAKGGTLLIFETKRMDDAKSGEDPAAGEYILYIELVPRGSSTYAGLEYASPAN